MPAKGDGITKRKDGRYVGRYTVHTPDGPKRKTIYGRKYKEVEKKLAEARGDAARGIVYDDANLKVGEYLSRWLTDCVRGTVRQRTYERYAALVRVHLAPAFERVELAKLRPDHVRGLYRSKLDGDPEKEITPLSPRTVLHIHRTLSKALKQAVSDGLIPRNAVASVKPPQPRREEIRPLNRSQVRALFEAASDAGSEALYVVAVTAGLRRGELQGLKWDDIDLDASSAMLQVRRTLSEPKGGYIFEPPKSGKGRNIRLTRKATAALKAHRKRQLEERMRLAGLWEDHDLVFPSSIGTPVSGSNLNRAFKAHLKRAGLPHSTRFHDLRHTCATLLLRQGVNPKFVQELLGHSDIALTLNVYSHVLPDMGDAAAEAMDSALG
ncbi:MAG: site-specific integrase [Rubrobacter sp.]|jgi:integrase|nr:site-specific integrase [Rubrobacter sp.]